MFSAKLQFVGLYLFFSGLCYPVNCQETCSSCGCLYIEEESLDCSGRSITNVTACESLGDCSPVRALNFSNNGITEVKDWNYLDIGSFDSGDCFLDFSHNQISVFFPSTGFFYCDYSSLTLDLSFNFFMNLSSESFGFSNHRFYQSLGALTFDFSANDITIIESNFLANVFVAFDIGNMTIDLSSNRITSLHDGMFEYYNSYYVSLFTVFFNDNDIVAFDLDGLLDDIYYFASMVHFNLSSNQLEGFNRNDSESAQLPAQRISLDLSGNRWNCSCTQRYVSGNSSDLRGILNNEMSVEPVCSEPPSVHNRPLLSLLAEEFICPPKLDPDAPSELVVNRGETIELRCPVLGADPPIERVDWEFSPQVSHEEAAPFQFQSTCFDCPLVISNVGLDAVGQYRCTVNNGESLTINQTVRLIGSPGDGTTTTSAVSSPPGDQETLSTPPRQTGLVVVVTILSVLFSLTSVALVVVGYKLYIVKRTSGDVGRSDTAVAFKYRPRPPKTPQPSAQASGQINRGMEGEEEEPYEVPNVDNKPSKSPSDDDIYEIQDRYVNN